MLNQLPVSLSSQQLKVTEQLYKGLSNEQIAAILGITVKTVKFHLTDVYKKKNVNSRTALLALRIAELEGRRSDR
jgi:LuxR family transcriptional regulator, positive regulator of biofilm formation